LSIGSEPNDEYEFNDGKIFLERISEEKALQSRVTYWINFHHDQHIYDSLKAGVWRELDLNDARVHASEFLQLIVECNEWEDKVEDSLCLHW
jgi:hypothetical protein